ncbi:UNKNOWN [Stylonychia lemnae]|uniref:Uncharacterized protein n=1 Tax=Stylonychia lemnae TaxID=5949 RepID=A0A078AR30_STYLE|nr:UNKNOWN [Stylonychia lemnae]|eukprot:CDW83333.1 UNKNOWN [Stylonychia lemnae]
MQILQAADSTDKILSLTGFEEINDLAVAMFQVLAYLEVQAQGYLDSDMAQIKQYFDPNYQSSQKDRLLVYLQLQSNLKKKCQLTPQTPNGNSQKAQSLNSSFAQSCNHKNPDQGRINSLAGDIKSLRLFKGQIITDELINQIIKEFDAQNLNFEKAIEDLEAEMKDYKKQYKSSNQDSASLKQQIVKLLEEKEELMNLNMDAKLDYDQQKLKMSKRIEELNDQLKNFNQSLKADSKSNDELLKQIESLENDVIQLKSNEENLENEIKFLLEQLDKFKSLDEEYKTLQSSTDIMMQDHQKLIEELNQKHIFGLDSLQGQLKQKDEEVALKLRTQLEEISKLKHENANLLKMQDETDNWKEQNQTLKLLLDSKLDYIQECESQIDQRNQTVKDLKMESDSLHQQIELLEKALREFTSSKKKNYDDSYEAVLRSEFELMRQKFEKQVQQLKDDITAINKNNSTQNSKNLREIEDLKMQRDTLSNRLVKIRLDQKQ